MGRASELLQRLPLQSRGEKRILLMGPEAAGKTSALEKLAPCSEQSPTSTQSIGFNVENVVHKGRSLSIWDVGFAGRDKIRPLLLPFYKGVSGIIFVVDSSRADRMEPARQELEKILEVEDARDAALLVLANKQDLPGSMAAAQVSEALGLHSMSRQWFVQPSSAALGDGLRDGLDWLSAAVFARSPSVGLPRFARTHSQCAHLLDGGSSPDCHPHAVPSPARSRRAPSTPQHCLPGWRSPKSGSSYSEMD